MWGAKARSPAFHVRCPHRSAFSSSLASLHPLHLLFLCPIAYIFPSVFSVSWLLLGSRAEHFPFHSLLFSSSWAGRPELSTCKSDLEHAGTQFEVGETISSQVKANLSTRAPNLKCVMGSVGRAQDEDVKVKFRS